MNKKKVFSYLGVGIGILALSGGLFLTNAKTATSDSLYLNKEYTVQKQAINTFDLDSTNLKSYFMRDIFDDSIATLSSDIRTKIVKAMDIKVGDFKPMIFLEGDSTVYIAVKHKDNTMTLNKFDISKEKPVKIDQIVKEIKQ